MNIFILCITIHQPEVMMEDIVLEEIVPGPEEAAIILWQRNHNRNHNATQFTSYSGKLYKINLEKKVIMEIPIPKISFEE